MDTELSHWLTCKKIHIQLTPGVPSTVYLRWAVQIECCGGETISGIVEVPLGSSGSGGYEKT